METNKKDPCDICKNAKWHGYEIGCGLSKFSECRDGGWKHFVNNMPDGSLPAGYWEILNAKPQEQPKHAGGRPPKFKTPEELEAKAEEYFRWCDANPVEKGSRKLVGAKQNSKGSEAKSDEVKFTAKRPYTLDGLAIFIGISRWRDMRDKECYQTPEFVAVINAIETRVRDQQITGALSGIFNPSIVARLNGLAEQVEANINTEQQQNAEDALKTLMGVADD